MDKTENTENPLYQYIDTPAGLEELIGELRSHPTIAIDTEADSFHHYQPKVCLIQISFSGQTFIVDPLAPMDIKPLLNELSTKELIIHDAGYDLRMMYADFNFRPKADVFDTMLGAGLAGFKNVSLSGVLEHVLNLKVTKHNQKANWAKRPLAENLLSYAAEDTAFLLQIKEHIQTKLEELGRTDWHTESCQQAVEAAYVSKEPTDPDIEWRIKGTGKLSQKEMALLRQLWYWRENIAKQTNLAPFMICRNEEMIKLAHWAAKRKKPIDEETKFPVRLKSNKQKTLIEALQTALALDPDQWPGPRKSDPSKRLPQSVRNTVNKLKSECEKIAEQLDLPLNLIASRAALTRIVVGNITTLEKIREKKILLKWQAELIIPAINRILKGDPA